MLRVGKFRDSKRRELMIVLGVRAYPKQTYGSEKPPRNFGLCAKEAMPAFFNELLKFSCFLLRLFSKSGYRALCAILARCLAT
jgi:hypothetical protein